MATNTVELFLVVDEEGQAAVALDDPADAMSAYNDNYCGHAIRTVKLNVTLTLPEVAEVSVTVPDEAGQTVTAEVAP